jgi:hypothetical protein
MFPKAMDNIEKQLTIFKNSFSMSNNQLAMGIMSIVGQNNTAKKTSDQGNRHKQEPSSYLLVSSNYEPRSLLKPAITMPMLNSTPHSTQSKEDQHT